MRFVALSLITPALMVAAPAFAQNLTITPSDQSAQSSHQASQQSTTQMENRLRESLEKAGFKNIRIRPEAFLVHAQAADGSRVTMMIGPDEVEGIVQGSGTSSNAPSSGSSGTNGSASTSSKSSHSE